MLKLQAQESAEDRGKKYSCVFRIIIAMKLILCMLIILLNSKVLLTSKNLNLGHDSVPTIHHIYTVYK